MRLSRCGVCACGRVCACDTALVPSVLVSATMADIAPEGNRASDAGTPPGGEPGVPRLPGNPRFFKPKSLYVRHVKVLPTDAHEK